MIKAARSHNPARLARDGRVRDAVRERDAVRINEAVLAIVSEAAQKMSMSRKQGDPPSERQLADAEEVVDWGIRTFASYVGAFDGSLLAVALFLGSSSNACASRDVSFWLLSDLVT